MGRSHVRAKVERRPNGETRVLLTGADGLAGSTDVTTSLVATFAHALWQARGGDDRTNWSDAEEVLNQLFASSPPPVEPAAPPRAVPPRKAPTRR